MPATDLVVGSPALRSPLTPVPYRIVKRRVELDDVVTMSVVPVLAEASEPFHFYPRTVQHADLFRCGGGGDLDFERTRKRGPH